MAVRVIILIQNDTATGDRPSEPYLRAPEEEEEEEEEKEAAEYHFPTSVTHTHSLTALLPSFLFFLSFFRPSAVSEWHVRVLRPWPSVLVDSSLSVSLSLSLPLQSLSDQVPSVRNEDNESMTMRRECELRQLPVSKIVSHLSKKGCFSHFKKCWVQCRMCEN